MRHIHLPSLAVTLPNLPTLPFHLHASTAGAALLVFLLIVLGLLLVLFRRNGRRQTGPGTGSPATSADTSTGDPAARPSAAGGPEPAGPGGKPSECGEPQGAAVRSPGSPGSAHPDPWSTHPDPWSTSPEPSGTEPATAGPGRAEQRRAALSQSLLGAAGTGEPEHRSSQSAPASAGPAEAEPAEQQPSQPGGATNGAVPEASRADLPQPEASQPEASRSESSQPEAAEPDPAHSEASGSESSQREPAGAGAARPAEVRPCSSPEPGPAGQPATKPFDAKDRLLGVLLADPGRALSGVTDLEACRGELDRLTESVHHQRRQLALIARRLRGAGLTPAQVAQLAGLGEGELATLLAEHAPSPSANHPRR
jgi:hypothetical protein